MGVGPVERRLLTEVSRRGTICLALIDLENFSEERASLVAQRAERCGVSGILVGGSTAVDQLGLDFMIKSIKKRVTKPVILFPGNVTGVAPSADAILFTSLLNSDNPYFITEAQALGALAVKKYGLEAIPVGYLVIGNGGAIGFVGRARGLPSDRPNLAAMYALAAQYMGMRFVYLEAGSGATISVSNRIVSSVRKVFGGTLIIGGGIRSVEDAAKIAKAGADILVLGTLLEGRNFEPLLKAIVKGVRHEDR